MTMKFSEALRLGLTLRPKACGYFFSDGGSCAQGAAAEAAGFPVNNQAGSGRTGYDGFALRNFLNKTWPELFVTDVKCPVCHLKLSGFGVIAHLNNNDWISGDHNWSREAIADWVETVERNMEHQASCSTHDNPVEEPCEILV